MYLTTCTNPKHHWVVSRDYPAHASPSIFLQRSRRFSKHRDDKNFPLGAEGSGVVLKCGPGVNNVTPGQHVACNSATFSEHAVVWSHMCYPVPEATAATTALTLSGVFACVAMDLAGDVSSDSRVLITAGAGKALSFKAQTTSIRAPPQNIGLSKIDRYFQSSATPGQLF